MRGAERNSIRSEQLGRSISATQSSFGEASSKHGRSAVVKALISRHNQRWENVDLVRSILGESSLETLHALFPVDVALVRTGASLDRHPASAYGDWVDHIAWGLDSICAAVRMLLAGNMVTAAVVARTQLERWHSNLATSGGLCLLADESQADFMTRVWGLVHPGCPDAGETWSELSEFLHGRGPMTELSVWESQDLLTRTAADKLGGLLLPIDNAILLSLRQMRHCVATHGVEHGFPREWGDLIAFMDDRFPSAVPFEPPMSTLWPLTMETLEFFGDFVESIGSQYEEDVITLAAGGSASKQSYWERAISAWIWRRSRSVRFARAAFRQEAEELGDEFNPASLRGREQQYILTAEVSALLSKWSAGPVSVSMSLASSGVRGAFWLWLEDDDRSMATARIILEQVARMRAHRLKPERALALESRGAQTSERDWLSAAGWRRLSTISRSVAEFGHAEPNAKWSGARQVLANFHTPFSEDRSSDPLQVARGDTLTMIVHLLAQELRNHIPLIAPSLSDELFEALSFLNEGNSDSMVEGWLNRSWEMRESDFGTSDFVSAEDFEKRIRESS
jgi:hypothetical protein